ncbi:hypothetical protein H0H87_000832 [Tephrocybe sp. NHM501043]|nr:hypothetical protein H0H87_000832 [Tephrocybe sp. NHM501043]
MASNTLLNTFRANKTAFGVWLTTGGVFHARTIAQASPHLSWILIDCEYDIIPLVPGAAKSVSAIHSTVPKGEPSALVRIPATGISTGTSWQIKYALDAGASFGAADLKMDAQSLTDSGVGGIKDGEEKYSLGDLVDLSAHAQGDDAEPHATPPETLHIQRSRGTVAGVRRASKSMFVNFHGSTNARSI